MDLIKELESQQLKKEMPVINVGDTVRVHVKIKEGSRERIQVFEGIVIAKKHGGLEETFTVRRLAYGVGVEKTFPVHSPNVEKVEIVRNGSPSTPPSSRRSRPCAAVMFAAPSCITCAAASVRLPRSARSCKADSLRTKKHGVSAMLFLLPFSKSVLQ